MSRVDGVPGPAIFKITSECGLLDELQAGQDVMADRGFTVETLLQQRGCRLIIPSFLGTHRTQLSAKEVTSTRRIAETRITCGADHRTDGVPYLAG